MIIGKGPSGDRIRIGLVGCGLIAQVMHLPHLAELDDRYEVRAICDRSEDLVQACGDRYRVPRRHTRWEDLLEEPLDALFVLTTGSHEPLAVAAAQAGMHVFVEKPVAFSTVEAQRMVDAARRADVRLMVGNMKRYDPAYVRLRALLEPLTGELRMVRVTTLEAPDAPYLAHHGIVRSGQRDSAGAAAAEREAQARIESTFGQIDPVTRWCYQHILLDNLVHEVNGLRGLLGDPDEISWALVSREHVSIAMRFGRARAQVLWADLPGLARYRQEFAFYAPNERLTLALPSPYLRNAPAELTIERSEPGSIASTSTAETVSFEDAFKLELIEFSRCIVEGREPMTSGEDGLRDLAVLEAVARVHLSGANLVDPVGSAAAP